MITYVNTVLVSNLSANSVFAPAQGHENPTSADAGKFVVVTMDEKPAANDNDFPYVSASTAGNYDTIKIGIVTDKVAPQVNYSTGAVSNMPVIKWSNKITVDSVKNIAASEYAADTEDIVAIDIDNIDDNILALFAQGGKRIIVRLTFKDMPHRYRKWTESYEYITKAADLVDATAVANYKSQIVSDLAAMINKAYKRARVKVELGVATYNSDGDLVSFTPNANGTVIGITAMKYDDDDNVESLSWYNKVRFNANVYFTDPSAEGWESTNKHFLTGAKIVKLPGKTYVASAKLVRDREAGAMGYEGILNRGEGTWPIIKPEMQTRLDGHYNAITFEFERMYRTADDLQRKTKECVEIYTQDAIKDAQTGKPAGIAGIIDAFVA